MILFNSNHADISVVVYNKHRADKKCIQNFNTITCGKLSYITHVQSVIVYQKAKQCEALKQQRLVQYVYNIADLFLWIQLWVFGVFKYIAYNVVRKGFVVND